MVLLRAALLEVTIMKSIVLINFQYFVFVYKKRIAKEQKMNERINKCCTMNILRSCVIKILFYFYSIGLLKRVYYLQSVQNYLYTMAVPIYPYLLNLGSQVRSRVVSQHLIDL